MVIKCFEYRIAELLIPFGMQNHSMPVVVDVLLRNVVMAWVKKGQAEKLFRSDFYVSGLLGRPSIVSLHISCNVSEIVCL
jgi:hypothetical protein